MSLCIWFCDECAYVDGQLLRPDEDGIYWWQSFAIADTYRPPADKDVLILLPCTKDKPYKSARSHQAIRSALNKDARIHIVTISGLYGPVPEELEEEPEVLQYDYVLSPEAKEQSQAVIDRLTDYLKRFGTHYKMIVAYVTKAA